MKSGFEDCEECGGVGSVHAPTKGEGMMDCPDCTKRAALIKEITDELFEMGCGCGFEWYAEIVVSALRRRGYLLR